LVDDLDSFVSGLGSGDGALFNPAPRPLTATPRRRRITRGPGASHARLRAPRGGHCRVSRLASARKTSSWPPGSWPTRRL